MTQKATQRRHCGKSRTANNFPFKIFNALNKSNGIAVKLLVENDGSCEIFSTNR